MTDQEIAARSLSDLGRIINGMRADIGGRYRDHPHASLILACLLSLAGAATAGGRDLVEASDALGAVSLRALARHGRHP